MNLKEYLATQQQLIEEELDRIVPRESVPPEMLHRAMRYSLFAGGKRIRPILCLEAARVISDEVDGAVTAACSLELIHTYSLIHDDLPALDNDDYRRGKLTNHKMFGEAKAILTGDALLTLAFEVLAGIDYVPGDRKSRMIAEVARAAGTVGGMIAGQVFDLEGEHREPDPLLLESIHRAKTGAMLRASLRLGALYAGAGAEQFESLSCYGEHVGLAFQIVDDVLDVEESSEALGKTAGKDARQHKITFPAVYGLEESKRMAERECEAARDALVVFGERARRLDELADLIVNRKA
jgi:geranylgeranyl diphosphate synthase type II